MLLRPKCSGLCQHAFHLCRSWAPSTSSIWILQGLQDQYCIKSSTWAVGANILPDKAVLNCIPLGHNRHAKYQGSVLGRQKTQSRRGISVKRRCSVPYQQHMSSARTESAGCNLPSQQTNCAALHMRCLLLWLRHAFDQLFLCMWGLT